MTIKTLLVTATLLSMPLSAWAQCAGRNEPDDRQAMSCLPGTQWDVATGLCIPVVSS